MRRALLISLLLVATLLPAPAQADTTVVVRSLDTPNYGLTVLSCDADPFSTLGAYALKIQKGPGTVPAGTRSWQYDGGGGDAGGPIDFGLQGEMTSIDTAEASFYSSSNEAGFAYALYQEPADADGSDIWVGSSALTLSGGQLSTWTVLSAIGRNYNWTKYTFVDGNYQPTGDPTVASTSVGTFANAHGTSGSGGYVLTMGCNGNPVNFDKFRIGHTGSITTYDFEAQLTTTLMKTSSGTINAGQSKILSGEVQPLFAGFPVKLQAKKFNATSWSVVGTTQTGSLGDGFSLTVKPMVQTSYRWVFPESDAALSSTSKVITIKVRMVVTAAPVAKVVNLGRLITIKGKVTPAKPGHEVTLYRKTATGKVKVGSAIIRADGTYAASVKATKLGTFKYFATVPAQSGNLADSSPIVSVSVVR